MVGKKTKSSKIQNIENMINIIDFDVNGSVSKKMDIISIAQQQFDLFDDATSNVFESLTKANDNSRNKQRELQKKISNYSEENDGRPTSKDFELYDEIGRLVTDEYWSIEQLNTLSEMKIVYLFKSVEITMKSLINTAYPQINTKDFFHWEAISSYFKSINIKLSDLHGYGEVTELRKINNRIKHNNTLNEEIKNIREFKHEEQFTSINLCNFHKRVKPKIQNFTKQLGEEIINDLYVFDDSRIEKISYDFKIRMEDEALEKLVAKLKDGKKPKNSH